MNSHMTSVYQHLNYLYAKHPNYKPILPLKALLSLFFSNLRICTFQKTPLNKSRPTPNRSTRLNSTRKALSEKNVTASSTNMTLFSQTGTSQGLVAGASNNLSTVTLASTGSYNDFAVSALSLDALFFLCRFILVLAERSRETTQYSLLTWGCMYVVIVLI